MRIGVDVRVFDEGRQSGVEQYAESILREIFAIDSVNEYVLFSNSFRSDGQERIEQLAHGHANVSLKTLRLPNKVLNSSFVLTGHPRLDTLVGKVDRFFSPNIKFGQVSAKTPHIITFHDLSFELYPEFYSFKKRWWHRVVNPKKIAKEAKAVIAVSEATARDLQERYRIENEKIVVIHSGAPALAKPRDAFLEERGIGKNFILFFATLEPRKNMNAVLQAYEMIRARSQENLQLVFAGATGWLESEIKKTWKGSAFSKDIIFTGPVSEEEKAALYARTKALLYVSLYEGFGFPPLEAMQLGTPVITSNSSSLPEVVENAALMVDPSNAEDIAEAILRITTDNELRNILSERGKKQAAKFSWKDAAQKTLEVLTRNYE